MNSLKAIAASVLALVALAAFSAVPARADTVKVGIILHYSGPFARLGDTMQKAIDLWVKEHGDSVNGTKIELIKRDAAGSVDTSKRLTQELITRDRVQFLAGYNLTPEALAAAPDVTEAKVPTVIMNAATAVITTKSPYFARTSLTLPQTTEILATWAATKGGIKRVYTAVSDYGPGIDAEASFKLAFAKAGGTVVDSVRFPLQNPDFAPFLQRVLDKKPQALFAFIPGGSQPVSFIKTFHDLGLDKAKIKLLPSAEAGDENDLQNLPDFAIGMTMATHYSGARQSKANEAFEKDWHAAYGANSDPDLFAVDLAAELADHVVDQRHAVIGADGEQIGIAVGAVGGVPILLEGLVGLRLARARIMRRHGHADGEIRQVLQIVLVARLGARQQLDLGLVEPQIVEGLDEGDRLRSPRDEGEERLRLLIEDALEERREIRVLEREAHAVDDGAARLGEGKLERGFGVDARAVIRHRGVDALDAALGRRPGGEDFRGLRQGQRGAGEIGRLGRDDRRRRVHDHRRHLGLGDVGRRRQRLGRQDIAREKLDAVAGDQLLRQAF